MLQISLSLLFHNILVSNHIVLMAGWLMNVDQLSQWEMVSKTEVLRENPPQDTLPTTNPTWPGVKLKPLQWKASN
jgi:hypothetical protein